MGSERLPCIYCGQPRMALHFRSGSTVLCPDCFAVWRANKLPPGHRTGYIPSQEEIAEQTALIRACWSPATEQVRAGSGANPTAELYRYRRNGRANRKGHTET